MGTRFEITLVSTQEAANQYLNAAQGEIERIERLISSWDANSQTAEINRQSGIKPVKVAKELYELIARSIEISKITQGAFDISYAALDPVWFFDGRMKAVPSESQRLKSVQNIGFKDLVLNAKEQTVYLPKKGMKIGFGAIGKGYAADATKKLMKSLGVSSGIINASETLPAGGKSQMEQIGK